MTGDANRAAYEAALEKWAEIYQLEDGRALGDLSRVELIEIIKDFIERQELARRKFP